MDDTFWWLPPSFSEEGDRIDELWNVITVIVVSILVLVQAALVYALVRFRSRGGRRRAKGFHGNQRLELLWTLIPSAVLVYVMVASQEVWAQIRLERPSEEERTVLVRVEARRFVWEVRYAGPDGVFDTADDFAAPNNVMVVPEGRPVMVQLSSQDVLHSFFVPYLRVKADAVPGLTTELWFTARSPGPDAKGNWRSFDNDLQILCAELCGDLHYNMKGFLWVVPEEEYAAWVAERAPTEEEGG